MSEFDQSNLDLSTETPSGPVECLGQTFESDDARREHYTELLREKLKDPEFRKIEGFPIGEDEDILALSDPPYYTACPNPWIEDFVKQHGRPYDPDEKYHREPFAADVSEGKNHPIYSAHSYHTKVPHRAIMRYILHYTKPDDVVFDGFCGTGMTGVAAQLCGDRSEVQELGYRVDQAGIIYDEDGNPFSRLGKRNAVLSDLSPAATFISSNFNKNHITEVEESFKKIFLEDDINKYQCLYSTISGANEQEVALAKELLKTCKSIEELISLISNGESFAEKIRINSKELSIEPINYIVWTDYFVCDSCGEEINYLKSSVNWDAAKFDKEFSCAGCGALIKKNKAKHKKTKFYDQIIGKTIEQTKQSPYFINYSSKGKNIRKIADEFDLYLVEKLSEFSMEQKIPSDELPVGFNTNQPRKSHGFSHVHHFYTTRNLIVIGKLWNKLPRELKWLATSFISRNATKLNRFIINKHNPRGRINGPLAGTLYVPSEGVEQNIFGIISPRKLNLQSNLSGNIIQTCSITSDELSENSVDYVFVDPPFGGNIMYSEMNAIWESWLNVKTSNKEEAITNEYQKKGLPEYYSLMKQAFEKLSFGLKPGRWITVEFSNTQASVWNAIQTAIQKSGLIVGNVSALNKKHAGQKAFAYPTPVKQDLVISAYKPTRQLELSFSDTSESFNAWIEFIEFHLKNLPISKLRGGILEFVAERDPRIIYDRMVSFCLGKNIPVPISSGEFQAIISAKYPDRDGMVFLPEQVAQYDKLAAKMESVGQMVVFVEDEKSAIGWLRQFLRDKPCATQDIQTDFMKQLSASWRKFETRPELSVLLDQNFLKYSGEGDVPNQITNYLSKNFHDMRGKEKNDSALQAKAKDRWYVPDPKKMADVEAQREKKLLAEFWEYAAQAGVERGQTQTSQASLQLGDSAKKKSKVKKLKEVRTDAVRAGFMECQRNNQGAVILAVAEILPANVIEEDEQLQMIYDMAEMRAG